MSVLVPSFTSGFHSLTIAPPPPGGVLLLHMFSPPIILSGYLLLPQREMGVDLRGGYTMGVQCRANKTE